MTNTFSDTLAGCSLELITKVEICIAERLAAVNAKIKSWNHGTVAAPEQHGCSEQALHLPESSAD